MLIRAGLGALLLAGCAATFPFVRPAGVPAGVITDEATGKHYSDCRAAFAAATSDTVLTFSAGSFQCGPEIRVAADWLVIRGAGLGHTFLETGEPVDPKVQPVPFHLTALRPGHFLQVEDVAFGGLTDLPSDDTHVELVRVAMATDRPALIGGSRDAAMNGSVVIVHSLLAGWTGARPPKLSEPKPIALQGNDKVVVIESVLYDVEQELERYPAPGAVVVLSEGVENAFAEHQPAARFRPDPSMRANVACGAKRNPEVFCAAEGQTPTGDAPVEQAAALLSAGKDLTLVETVLRSALTGFSNRFADRLGAAIRQPDGYWFDQASAQNLEQEGRAAPSESVALLAQTRLNAVIDRCAQTNQPASALKKALAMARRADHILRARTAEDGCKEKIHAQADTLLADCARGWDWMGSLSGLAVLDSVVGGGEYEQSCRQILSGRFPAARGAIAELYLREVSRALHLAGADDPDPIPSLAPVVKLLPWIVTRAGRTILPSPTVMGHLLQMAQAPEASDGRQLVETTLPCAVSNAGSAERASTTIRLAEQRANAKVGEDPRVVLELPVEVTADSTGSDLSLGLVPRCEEQTGAVYLAGLRQYFTREIDRLLSTTTGPIKADLEVVSQMIHAEAEDGGKLPDQSMPLIAPALAKVEATIEAQSTDVTPIAQSRLEDQPLMTRAPPTWSAQDIALAADQLARAPAATADGCQIAMPDIPWGHDDLGARGAVTVGEVPFFVECRPRAGGFSLMLVPADPTKVSPALIDEVMRMFVRHMTWPKRTQAPAGPMLTWKTKSGRMVKLCTKAHPGAELATVDIDLGSTWPK